MTCRSAARAIAGSVVVVIGVAAAAGCAKKKKPGEDGAGVPPPEVIAAGRGSGSAAPVTTDAGTAPDPDAAATAADASTGPDASAAAATGPIRVPTIDCEATIPAKVIAKHAKGGRLESIEGGCRLDRGGQPFAIFHARCAPEGTPRWTGAVPAWKDVVGAAVPASEDAYRMSETSLFGRDIPCLLVSRGIEMTWPKFQGMTDDINKAFEPVLAKQFGTPAPTE